PSASGRRIFSGMRVAHDDTIGARATCFRFRLKEFAIEAWRLPPPLSPPGRGEPPRRPDPPFRRACGGARLRLAVHHRPPPDCAAVVSGPLGRAVDDAEPRRGGDVTDPARDL